MIGLKLGARNLGSGRTWRQIDVIDGTSHRAEETGLTLDSTRTPKSYPGKRLDLSD